MGLQLCVFNMGLILRHHNIHYIKDILNIFFKNTYYVGLQYVPLILAFNI